LADIRRITLNASCMMISGGRAKQLDIFCRTTGFTSDFLSFIVVELIRFFHSPSFVFEHKDNELHSVVFSVLSVEVQSGT